MLRGGATRSFAAHGDLAAAGESMGHQTTYAYAYCGPAHLLSHVGRADATRASIEPEHKRSICIGAAEPQTIDVSKYIELRDGRAQVRGRRLPGAFIAIVERERRLSMRNLPTISQSQRNRYLQHCSTIARLAQAHGGDRCTRHRGRS